MKAVTVRSNVYTDTPGMHPNLLVGSLQLLVWLLFHPSAWRNYLGSFGLSPNVSLVAGGRGWWREGQVRRLVGQGHLIVPALSSGVIAIGLWAVGGFQSFPVVGLIFGLILGIGVSLGGSLLFGSAGSILLGMMAGVAGTVTAGLQLRLGVSPDGIMIGSVPFGVNGLSLFFGLLIGLGGSLIGEVMNDVSVKTQTYARRRQFGGTVIGLLMGVGLLFVVGLAVAGGQLNTLLLSLAVTALAGLTAWWRRGWLTGVVVAVGLVVAFQFPAVWFGVLVAGLLVPAYLVTERLAGPWPGAVASALGGGGGWIAANIAASQTPLWPGILFAVAGLLLGLSFSWWRPLLLYPFLMDWNNLLLYADKQRGDDRPSLLPYNSAFWDERQRFRLVGLDEHLLLVHPYNPGEGQLALDYLSSGPQRWAAQAVQQLLDIETLAACRSVTDIATIHEKLAIGELSGPNGNLLYSFGQTSRDAQAALARQTRYNQQLALAGVESRLERMLIQFSRSNDPTAVDLQRAVKRWRQVVSAEVAVLVEKAGHEPLANPYVFGPPLPADIEIFCGRTEVSRRIEQLLLEQPGLPLMLYGQRRVGKTSLLNRLNRMLPQSIVPMFVDLQSIARAKDSAGLLYLLAKAMRWSAQNQRGLSLPSLARETLEADPYPCFYDWLDAVEACIDAAGYEQVLLALDEFEVLDRAISNGHVEAADILGMLRTIVQHRRRFYVLLAGSHSMVEFKRWAHYFVNLHLVHLSYLEPEEARQLIERPIADFPLTYEPAATEHVIALTKGHPALIQLLCAEIINARNKQAGTKLRPVSRADVEAAVPAALSEAGLFLKDVAYNMLDEDGLAVATYLAEQGEGAVVERGELVRQFPSVDLDEALRQMQRRDLVETVAGSYRYQVELVRRFFVGIGKEKQEAVAGAG